MHIFKVIIQFSGHKSFKTPHDNGGESRWSVITVFFRARLRGDWSDIWDIFHSGTGCVSTES